MGLREHSGHDLCICFRLTGINSYWLSECLGCILCDIFSVVVNAVMCIFATQNTRKFFDYTQSSCEGWSMEKMSNDVNGHETMKLVHIRHVVICVSPSIFHNSTIWKVCDRNIHTNEVNNFLRLSDKEVQIDQFGRYIHTPKTNLMYFICVRINIWDIQIFANILLVRFFLSRLFFAFLHRSSSSLLYKQNAHHPYVFHNEREILSILRMQHTNILLNKQ